MSCSFRLTARARSDLASIGRYTARRWGKAQRNRYLAALDARFHWLAGNPQRGRARPEIGKGVLSFPEGSHLVFYLIRETDIVVIGIPHQAMDYLTDLAKDPYW